MVTSSAMDRNNVYCVSPRWRTDEHLIHLDNFSSNKSHNDNFATWSVRSLLSDSNLAKLDVDRRDERHFFLSIFLSNQSKGGKSLVEVRYVA